MSHKRIGLLNVDNTYTNKKKHVLEIACANSRHHGGSNKFIKHAKGYIAWGVYPAKWSVISTVKFTKTKEKSTGAKCVCFVSTTSSKSCSAVVNSC